jgi:hypothetical protein
VVAIVLARTVPDVLNVFIIGKLVLVKAVVVAEDDIVVAKAVLVS